MDESSEVIREIDEEHGRLDKPARTLLLTRKWKSDSMFGGMIERMWIQGYPRVRLIVLTMPKAQIRNGELPGAVKEIPLTRDEVATEQAFLDRFDQIFQAYRNEGWELELAVNGGPIR